MSLFNELKRRNVFRVAIAYLAAAWLLVEVTDTIFPYFSFGDTAVRILIILLAIGFPLFLVFSWVFEFTPEGLKLEKDVRREESIAPRTGKGLDRVVIVLLALALGYFAFDRFVLDPARDAALVEETAQRARSEAMVESYGEKSIAVLPFVDLSPAGNQEYFSDGISEELLNLLARIPELRVISRSSSFSFKGKDVAIPEVAQQLNVAHVLEGSVRKSGNRVRITAQLIEARSDAHVWSQSYDRELDDIFAVQDEIAAAISNALKVNLALVATEGVQPTAIKAASSAAYDAYLRGRELMRHPNRESLEGAIRHLEHSLRLDDSFAPAHAELAVATFLLTGYVASPRQEARRTALTHLDRAQALEPDLAEAHAGRALLAQYDNDPESTIEHARKALAANPNHIDAMHNLRFALQDLGRYEEAEAIREQMLRTDPRSISVLRMQADWLASRGRIEEAHEVADQLLALSPATAYEVHARVSLSEGKFAESLSWSLRAPAGKTSAAFAFAGIGEYEEARRTNPPRTFWIDVAEGRWDEAIRATQTYMQLYPDSAYITIAAEVLFAAGRIDEALPLYERALDLVPEGRPLRLAWPLLNTLWLAHARRLAGDEEGAQSAARIVRQDHAALAAIGVDTWEQHLAGAMIAAFEHDPDRAAAALKSAVNSGLRIPGLLDNAVFEDWRDESRFVALRAELDAILAAEHAKVLQLICFNNPAPDDWQPMPETCDGVEKLQD